MCRHIRACLNSLTLRVATIVLLLALDAHAQSTLPYESDFESPNFTLGFLQSDPHWAFDPLSLSVEITAAEAASANQSLALQGSTPFT